MRLALLAAAAAAAASAGAANTSATTAAAGAANTSATTAITAPAAAAPCYAVINGGDRTVETPCATTLVDYQAPGGGARVVLRAYAPGAAHVVEAAVALDPGGPFDQDVAATADYVFGYFTGVNVGNVNLTGALTAPYSVRPPVVGTAREDWVGAMALAPSAWPPARAPPAPRADGVALASWGGVVMAAAPVVLKAKPTESDFRDAVAALEATLPLLPLPGRWRVNASSPLSPTFSFFFTQAWDGGVFGIEAAAEVYHTAG